MILLILAICIILTNRVPLEQALFDFHVLGLEENGVPFKSSYQQGPEFPTGSDFSDMVDLIDAAMPLDADTDKRVLIAQMVTLPGPTHSNSNIALPFQDDVMGVVFDVWNFSGADPDQREFQDLVISSLGGVDHRMFWAAYDDICLECGAWDQYYEDRQKYIQLSQFKNCVDPKNLFSFRMSMPTTPFSNE